MSFGDDLKKKFVALQQAINDFFTQFEPYVLISSGLIFCGLVLIVVGIFL